MARSPFVRGALVLAVLAAVRGVDAGAIPRSLADKSQIPVAVHAARVAAVRKLGLDDETNVDRLSPEARQ